MAAFRRDNYPAVSRWVVTQFTHGFDPRSPILDSALAQGSPGLPAISITASYCAAEIWRRKRRSDRAIPPLSESTGSAHALSRELFLRASGVASGLFPVGRFARPLPSRCRP